MTKKNILLKDGQSQTEALYQRWLSQAEKHGILDRDIEEELYMMKEDKKRIEEAFYKELTFGTGGIRGIIGAGSNRINVHTIAKASQGLANYIIMNAIKRCHGKCEYQDIVKKCKIAVSYDSRIKSQLFAEIACQVFAGNGIKVYIYR